MYKSLQAEWLTLNDIVGLPGLPTTYSGVRSAWRRGRWKRLSSKSGTGPNPTVLVHISELPGEARNAYLTKNEELYVDIVDDAYEHLSAWKQGLDSPVRLLALTHALTEMFSEGRVKHTLKMLHKMSKENGYDRSP